MSPPSRVEIKPMIPVMPLLTLKNMIFLGLMILDRNIAGRITSITEEEYIR